MNDKIKNFFKKFKFNYRVWLSNSPLKVKSDYTFDFKNYIIFEIEFLHIKKLIQIYLK